MSERGKILEFVGSRGKNSAEGDSEEERERNNPRVMEINRLDSRNPEEPVVLAVCTLDAGKISFEGSNVFIKNLEQDGVFTRDGEKVFPKDGEKFFEALLLNFRNPYLYAQERRNK